LSPSALELIAISARTWKCVIAAAHQAPFSFRPLSDAGAATRRNAKPELNHAHIDRLVRMIPFSQIAIGRAGCEVVTYPA
jgi:hypothetical protein